MACTVGWISLGPMLLTVTRPVAAEGLDLGPPCEDRQWKAITLSAWVDGDNLCQLLPWKTQDAHATLAQALSLWHFIKKRKNTCKHMCTYSYMTDCLLLHSTAQSCNTAKCELCTCPWNHPRISLKKRLDKIFVYFLFLTHNYVWAYPRATLTPSSPTSVKFYLIDFQQFHLVNPPSLSCLAYCVDVRPCCRHCLS